MLRAALVAALTALVFALSTAPAGAINRYQLAGGCYALRTEAGFNLIRSGDNYRLTTRTVADSTHFRMQATALGSYLLFDDQKEMPRVGAGSAVLSTSKPGPSADWLVSGAGHRGFKLKSVESGEWLGIKSSALATVDREGAERFRFVRASGCVDFPEMTVNASGKPFSGRNAAGGVDGFVDDHMHLMAFEFMGGYFHCGRPWSPYGVTVALRDCQGDEQLSSLADNILAGDGRAADAPTDGGWPDFKNWPRRDSLLREATYWKSIERAWRAGLRVMVNELVQNDALCEIWPVKRTKCDDMTAIRLQYDDTLALQDYIDAQAGGPGKGFFRVVRSPRAARKVIEAGKLAVVNSVESSAPFGCSQYRGQPRCTVADIDKGLDEFQRMGVVGLFPVHKFDNALGGTHYDEATTGLLVGIGQNFTSGQWWNPQTCPSGETDFDNTPTAILGPDAYNLFVLLGATPGDFPAYPRGPLCNPKGLTNLGRYVINEMMRRGMIIETDHLSVKARREAMTMLEQARYPGLISSHSWGDVGSTKRLQALGGMVGPIIGGGSPGANQLYSRWQSARENRRRDLLFGLGFASDIGGLAKQYGPLPVGPENPGSKMTYPFRSYDGGVVFDRHKTGNRTYDYDVDGVAQYGLYADWFETARRTGGPDLMRDLFNGSEAYLQLWQRTRSSLAAN
jgi:microsomal dipeptidase-like Zn-dependent dipeptidase